MCSILLTDFSAFPARYGSGRPFWSNAALPSDIAEFQQTLADFISSLQPHTPFEARLVERLGDANKIRDKQTLPTR